MVPADWIEHRRSRDGELIGWIRPEGDDWVPVDLLGAALCGPVDWASAEAALDERGLGWLSGVWTLEVNGVPTRVRIVHVGPDGITVQTDDFGAIDVPVDRFDLPWPAPPKLRPS